MPSRYRPSLALALTLAAGSLVLFSGSALAVTLGTSFTRSTEAAIEIDGTIVAADGQSIPNGPAESTVTEGTITSPIEARASGRSLALSMTSNAEYVDRSNDFATPAVFDGVHSRAEIFIEAVSLTRSSSDFLYRGG